MNDPQLQAAYTSATGQPAGRVERLPGGAGNRIYWRVHPLTGDESAVVMELPADPVKSEEASKEHKHEELPFLNVHRYLERIGVRVPRLLLDASDDGFLVIEDLSSFIRGVHKGRTAVPHLRTLVLRPPDTASRKAMAG